MCLLGFVFLFIYLLIHVFCPFFHLVSIFFFISYQSYLSVKYLSHYLIIFSFHLIFKNLFIFNWRIIALQCCVGFWHTSPRTSHRYTYVTSLQNLPPTSHPILPLYVVTEHQSELPELYSIFPHREQTCAHRGEGEGGIN